MAKALRRDADVVEAPLFWGEVDGEVDGEERLLEKVGEGPVLAEEPALGTELEEGADDEPPAVGAAVGPPPCTSNGATRSVANSVAVDPPTTATAVQSATVPLIAHFSSKRRPSAASL